MSLFKKFVCLMLPVLAIGCNTNTLFEEFAEIPEATWSYDHQAVLDFEIADTTKRYDLYMLVRHRTTYPYMNFWVNTLTTYPDGTTREQKVDLPMADKNGQWYGSGFGNVKTNEVIIQSNAIMPQKGAYTLDISQLMRYEPVLDVMDIGLRIEESSE